MHFTTCFGSLLVASVVVANPIARVAAIGAPALAPRQTVNVNTCHVGVPCRVQKEIDDCQNDIITASALVNDHLDDAGTFEIIAQVKVTASAVLTTAQELPGFLVGLTTANADALKADIVADISLGISQIRARAESIRTAVPAASVAVDEVIDGIDKINAIVGYCG